MYRQTFMEIETCKDFLRMRLVDQTVYITSCLRECLNVLTIKRLIKSPPRTAFRRLVSRIIVLREEAWPLAQALDERFENLHL